METTISVAAAALTLVASSAAHASADPPFGFVKLADSVADFAGTQGGNGWWYLFGRGFQASPEEMPFHFFSYDRYRWCATPSYGGTDYSTSGSHCMLQDNGCHTNSGAGCQTPAQGVLCPIREWRSSNLQHPRVHLKISAGTDQQLFELLSDGIPVWSRVYPQEQIPSEGVWIEVASSSKIALRTSPLGLCAGSTHELRIYAPDCNGDGNADALQIQSGELSDLNGDGIPDICQQTTCVDADLFRDFNINGADLGILLSQWGPSTPLTVSDINNDGVVNGADLGLLLSFWGACP